MERQTRRLSSPALSLGRCFLTHCPAASERAVPCSHASSSGRPPGAGQCGQMPASSQPQAQGEEEDGDGTKGELTALHARGCCTIISHNSSRECQEASVLPPTTPDRRTDKVALRQEPGLRSLETIGLRLVGESWALQPPKSSGDHISKRYFPGCKLRPSAFET